MEITNPGTPLVDPDRFIDFPPQSRNEALASLMRCMGLCEEMGTGIDKVVEAVEMAQLPAPEFRAEANATRVSLFGPAPLCRHDGGGTAARLLPACRIAPSEREASEECLLARSARCKTTKCRPDIQCYQAGSRERLDPPCRSRPSQVRIRAVLGLSFRSLQAPRRREDLGRLLGEAAKRSGISIQTMCSEGICGVATWNWPGHSQRTSPSRRYFFLYNQ